MLPFPLKEARHNRASDIWLKELLFTPGARIHIKAPSGTGKSTLIHSLYGLRHDYDGNISFRQHNLRQADGEAWAKWRQQDLSIVFQDLRLFSQLTALENIQIKNQLTNHYPAEKIHAIAAQLGIEDKLDQSCGTLSYGEQQRVAIIRALMQPFVWILLDEPFSHLDEQNTRKAADLIRSEAGQRQAGIIIVDLEDDNRFDYTMKLSL